LTYFSSVRLIRFYRCPCAKTNGQHILGSDGSCSSRFFSLYWQSSLFVVLRYLAVRPKWGRENSNLHLPVGNRWDFQSRVLMACLLGSAYSCGVYIFLASSNLTIYFVLSLLISSISRRRRLHTKELPCGRKNDIHPLPRNRS
jgi:hypothetical protein